MIVKQLKEILADLPDGMDVVLTDEDEDFFYVELEFAKVVKVKYHEDNDEEKPPFYVDSLVLSKERYDL